MIDSRLFTVRLLEQLMLNKKQISVIQSRKKPPVTKLKIKQDWKDHVCKCKELNKKAGKKKYKCFKCTKKGNYKEKITFYDSFQKYLKHFPTMKELNKFKNKKDKDAYRVDKTLTQEIIAYAKHYGINPKDIEIMHTEIDLEIKRKQAFETWVKQLLKDNK